ncbi:transcription antitermination factor NusB [Nocardioides sp. 1609]|uniref:transcription antitermination factor NusB n=1 Tax=Nocardioides sp. 1609 TaxID=2508327 RepID=UPI00106F26AA|nr:transcription antitermination factor NusB [Nocardioides sp. 1609]
MTARSKARRRALDILYAAEMRRESAVEALERATEAGEGPTNPYTGVLVRGVAAETDRIDELLSSYSRDWTLDRMPAVDRNVLRIGLWEMLYADDVPGTVAITEAIALVQELSTDESPTFVNGVLGAIQRSGVVADS